MKETYKMAKEIKEVTGLNFLEKNRKTEYVEARSFFVHILKNYYKYRNKDIINIFNELGFAMDSATLCHSLKMFEVYERNNVRICAPYNEKNILELDNSCRKLYIYILV